MHLRPPSFRQSSSDAQSKNSDCSELTPCPKLSIELCDEVSRLFTTPISSEQSKAVSTEFSLSFEEPDFSLKPPKLALYQERRVKSKGIFSDVKAKDDVLSKIQLVVMDIAPPLLELRDRLGECGGTANPMSLRIERTVQCALEQWGRAYHHCTKLRRESYVKYVEPNIKYLLKEADAILVGKKARKNWFSDALLSRQLKKAQN